MLCKSYTFLKYYTDITSELNAKLNSKTITKYVQIYVDMVKYFVLDRFKQTIAHLFFT